VKILRSRRPHYVARVSIFLITVALIAGIAGCGGGGVEYDLTIGSTAGGSVTTPGEGTFAQDTGTDVDLVAEPEPGYYFVNWIGDVDTIANVNAAATTITMNDSYSIMANFEAIPAAQHTLIISSTTEGWLFCGSVTTPGEGTFIYGSGTVVNLVAQAEELCQFVGWTGDVGTIADVNATTTTITINGDYSIRANFRPIFSPMLAAGWGHTIGLRSDGTVVAVGDNDNEQCNVGGWTDITQIAAGWGHTVGLKSDDTIVAVGDNDSGQCNVGNWTDIIGVAAGGAHTVGLKSEGTVVAVGWNTYGQCNVGSRSWTGVIQVAAGWSHTVGLRSDGTVVAVGSSIYGQCNVGGWTDIIQISAGDWHTVGLRSDGTVVAVGDTGYGQCNVGGWSAILQVAAGYWHTVGLKDDGTIVAVGDNYYRPCDVVGWADIVHVAAASRHTVGLRSDGTVVAAGNNAYGQCDVVGWDLF
jgi:hypothetical protein